MKTKAAQIDRICLWILLAGGLIGLLYYGLTSFLAQPTVETITTHATNATNSNNTTEEIKFQSHKSK